MLKAWMNPRWRVWFFLVLINFAWAWSAWAWLERETWLWIMPLALSINFLLLTYDQVLRFGPLQGQLLLGSDPWGVLKMVHELCESFAVPVPHVYILPQPTAQILCYGKTRKQARLLLTEGALSLLNFEELRAVITFQMIVNKSSFGLLNYWIAAWLDLGYRLGKICERCFAFVFGWTPPLAAWFISPWLAILHFFLISSTDFQKLDRATVRHLQRPEDLARALWKMEAYAQTQPWAEPWVFAHMCMVSPLKFSHFLSPLRIQPPVKRRIKDLVGHYPL